MSDKWFDDFIEPWVPSLFEVLRCFALASGGDGDGYLVSGEHWKEWADRFQIDEMGQKYPHFVERHDEADQAMFSANQEYIAFVKDRSRLPSHYAPDIVIEVL